VTIFCKEPAIEKKGPMFGDEQPYPTIPPVLLNNRSGKRMTKFSPETTPDSR
jgi:hypothetical protein